MWKCKKCGSEHIICDGLGSLIVKGRVSKNKTIDVSTITADSINFDNIDEDDIDVFNYWCDECGNNSHDVEDIAKWIDDQCIKD